MEVVEEFWMELENAIMRTPKRSTLIVGGDINACIGNCLSHPPSDKQYSRPCRDQYLNDANSRVLPMMQRCVLGAALTLFSTW
jgi:hypothetical protein